MTRGHLVRRFLLALSLPLLAASSGAAQTTLLTDGPDRMVKHHYRNSGGEKGLSTIFYDHNGLPTRARWELLDGTRSSENYQTLDRAGHVVRKYREFSDGLTSDVIYKWDDAGKLVSETFSRSDGVRGKSTYEYDDEGRLAKANCDHLNSWFVGTILYRHDDEGRLFAAQLQKDGQGIGTIAYRHDSRGNLVEEHWDFGGRWNQTSTYEYEEFEQKTPPSWASTNVYVVNTADYRIVGESYDFNQAMTGTSGWEYDEDGKLVGKSYVTSEGLRTDTTMEYDAAGLLTRTTRKYSNGWTAVFRYEYNGNRRLVRRSFERSDGAAGSEAYEYDARMRLTRGILENFDSWITGTITYAHDETGRVKTGKFEGEKFNADLTFDRDEDGNPTRIHWAFDFGKTQTYSMEYVKIEPRPESEKPEKEAADR